MSPRSAGAAHLDEAPDRLAIRGHDVLLIRMHDAVALGSPEVVLRQVQVDLVTVEIGVERRAVGVVHTDDTLALQHSSPSLS